MVINQYFYNLNGNYLPISDQDFSLKYTWLIYTGELMALKM